MAWVPMTWDGQAGFRDWDQSAVVTSRPPIQSGYLAPTREVTRWRALSNACRSTGIVKSVFGSLWNGGMIMVWLLLGAARRAGRDRIAPATAVGGKASPSRARREERRAE